MKKRFILLALSLLAAGGCAREPLAPDALQALPEEALSHEMIVLGDKLEDPYSVRNMTKALASLYPTKAPRIDVSATDIYVRFLPETEAQYNMLERAGLALMDHPVDYQIVRDGDYYHDPEIPEDRITWQYAVVPRDFRIPPGIKHEILDECFIPDENMATRSPDGFDWAAVERESFRLTGNAELLQPLTRATEAGKPSGRITIVDDAANGGKPFGVAGVKVVCNTFVKFASAYTDRDGYYEIGTTFSADVRYRLMFKNQAKFSIGLNKILVPASSSTLGKGTPQGKDETVTPASDRRLFCRCVVNNAIYDYISRCKEDDLGILAPPADLRVWIFQKIRPSSAAMLHHGAFVENDLLTSMVGEYIPLVKIFLPDVTIGASGKDTYARLYSETVHEMAHASHFAQVGKEYWDKFIEYILTAFASSGGDVYGSGSGNGAGHCEVGEMWAYFLQNKIYHDRYGGAMPENGNAYWFQPQILRYLNERGMSVSQIFSALGEDVTDKASLRRSLLALYPEFQAVIDQVFARYTGGGDDEQA